MGQRMVGGIGMDGKEQRARELPESVREWDAFVKKMHGRPSEKVAAVLYELGNGLRNDVAAALPDEQPAQGEVRAAFDNLIEAADYLIDSYMRLWKGGVVRDLQESESAYTRARDLLSLRLLAPPAGPAVEALMAALRPFAAMRLSSEGEVSDLVLRSPAEEMRRSAAAIEQRDMQIRTARELTRTHPPTIAPTGGGDRG